MKKRTKFRWCMIGAIAALYIILLGLLYISERSNSQATIHTFRDAFWYSLVTLTTVGYGDVTPVTPIGRAVGIIFLLLATGIIVTMLGAVVTFITSEGIPLFFLRFLRRKNWYYFAECSAQSGTLAANICKEDANALIIFGEKQGSRQEMPAFPCMFLNISPAELVARKKNTGKRCKIFFMKENDIGINSRANNISELPVDVYARTTSGQDRLSGNINFFHSYECCARQYWHSKPLCSNEQVVVIIGFGYYGQSLLEWAILANVLAIDQHVAYHIFGDEKEFLALHYRLDTVFSLNEESGTRDSLCFHNDFWGEHTDILERADRIIICDDDECTGWDVFWKLKRYYRLRGRIDLRSNRKAPGVSYFGTDEEIYTPKQIMRTALNSAAIIINDIFRKSVKYPTLSWEELDDFHRRSKMAAADHLLMKIRILLKDETITEYSASVIKTAYDQYRITRVDPVRKEQYRNLDHMRWLRFYSFCNWTYGPVRNDEKREHPMMCRYEELTPEQKKERDVAWDLMGTISKELDRRHITAQ